MRVLIVCHALEKDFTLIKHENPAIGCSDQGVNSFAG